MAKDYSGVEREAIVASMLEAAMPPLRQIGDFTLSEYIEKLRGEGYEVRGRGPVRNRLEQQVEAGKLAKLTVWDNEEGGTVVVYRVVSEGGG